MALTTSDIHDGTSTDKTDNTAHWSGVFAMSLCVFTLIASEFMPVSLLTPIASDLQITEGMAGQGIAISGAFAVLTSLLLPMLIGTMDRKKLMLMLTVLMGISGSIVALAPNYPTYMLGRALIGVVIGGFWSMSAAMAIRLVPSNKVPKALAIFNGGNALATVIAAPLGSYLGSIVGWRGAFLAIIPIALITLIWQWMALPSMKGKASTPGSGNILKALKSRAVAYGMAGCGAFFMGQFALFTYLRPFLETVTQTSVSTLSLLLLTIGFSGFIGTLIISSILKRTLYGLLIGIPVFMAAIAVMLIPAGSDVAPVALLLAMWGLVATAAPVAWWTWLAKAMPHNAEAGGGLMVAVVQLSIALGSTIGGILFDADGYQSTFIASAAVLLISAFLTFHASRMPIQ
ncbi:Predicted arabinose efflux permease, MFS family [Marinomonas polaris DSM 16579]|uniref:Predicted arabinose efflux permease, MFS family n=1 Tax=Marinomonas polaris DSM 16579 TaxID=1122206 RepID=A0A1M5HWL9_9GAMM|nr:MFS transporter [Marinomonas polaris]SHG20361.1 Predicted arabinose efflux permease, MFS family [Marinomonas polaris DSM 16579]